MTQLIKALYNAKSTATLRNILVIRYDIMLVKKYTYFMRFNHNAGNKVEKEMVTVRSFWLDKYIQDRN